MNKSHKKAKLNFEEGKTKGEEKNFPLLSYPGGPRVEAGGSGVAGANVTAKTSTSPENATAHRKTKTKYGKCSAH